MGRSSCQTVWCQRSLDHVSAAVGAGVEPVCQIIADALALLSGDLVSLVMGPEITAAKLTWMKWLAYARLVITASRCSWS